MIRGLILLAGALLVMGAAVEPAAPPVILSPAEAAKQGRALSAEILARLQVQNFTNAAVLKVRDQKGKRTEIPVRSQATPVGENKWMVTYETTGASNHVWLQVVHENGKGNRYLFKNSDQAGDIPPLAGSQILTGFAGTDFWLADLGVEFLSWPEQRLVRKEMRRGQACSVLESVNPQPAPGAYSRVVSWIDNDTDGIINADAYDANGKVLKQFAAKSFKKIHGEWELKSIEMLNRQTGSQTTLEFDLGSK